MGVFLTVMLLLTSRSILKVHRTRHFARFLGRDRLASEKPSGREKGSSAYSSVEHVALLSTMSQVPDAFNCSESSPQWKEVFKRMIAELRQ
jgi:hypothetical protein